MRFEPDTFAISWRKPIKIEVTNLCTALYRLKTLLTSFAVRKIRKKDSF